MRTYVHTYVRTYVRAYCSSIVSLKCASAHVRIVSLKCARIVSLRTYVRTHVRTYVARIVSLEERGPVFHRAVKLDPEKNSRACARCQRRRARAGDWDDRGGHLRRWGEGIRNNKGMDSKSPFLGTRGSARGHVQIDKQKNKKRREPPGNGYGASAS